MEAFVASLIFVVLAEMGDKTQLLAMAFSCRFRWQSVMWGVFVATAANHLMAAALGNLPGHAGPARLDQGGGSCILHIVRALDHPGRPPRGRRQTFFL